MPSPWLGAGPLQVLGLREVFQRLLVALLLHVVEADLEEDLPVRHVCHRPGLLLVGGPPRADVAVSRSVHLPLDVPEIIPIVIYCKFPN